jgi:heme exporter protein D
VAALGPHAGFIVAAYLAAAGIIFVLVMWIVVDGRLVRRRIAALEAAGHRRRSAPPESVP